MVILTFLVGCDNNKSSTIHKEENSSFDFTEWKVEILNRNASYIPLGYIEYADDYFFDEFLEEGASSTLELLSFLQNKFPNVTAPIMMAQYGCSTFTAKMNNENRIFARNFDYRAYSPAVIVCTPSSDGVYGSVSTCSLGFLGYTEENIHQLDVEFDKTQAYMLSPYLPLDGMNEKGLSIAVLQLNERPVSSLSSKKDITTTTAIRMILNYCATVDEAIDMLKKYDMHTDDKAFHFQIADSSGASAVVEYSKNGEMFVTQESHKPLICTNHYVSSSLIDSQTDADSERRKTLLENELVKNEGIFSNETAAMQQLKAVSKNVITRWSIIYNLTECSMDICISGNYSLVYSFNFS